MDYREGSMGLAIFLGFLVFAGLDALFSLLFLGSFFGATLSGFTLLAAGFVSVPLLISSIITPLAAGAVAGLIAKGSAGRGFMAGFLSIVVYGVIMFIFGLIFILVVGVAFGPVMGAQMGAGAQQAQGFFIGAAIIAFLIGVIIGIVVFGVIAGIAGALMSAMFASSIGASGAQSTQPIVSTTIVQAPASPAAPFIVQSGGGSAPAGKTITCPACREQNDTGSTFCQSCGTRLKS